MAPMAATFLLALEGVLEGVEEAAALEPAGAELPAAGEEPAGLGATGAELAAAGAEEAA